MAKYIAVFGSKTWEKAVLRALKHPGFSIKLSKTIKKHLKPIKKRPGKPSDFSRTQKDADRINRAKDFLRANIK